MGEDLPPFKLVSRWVPIGRFFGIIVPRSLVIGAIVGAVVWGLDAADGAMSGRSPHWPLSLWAASLVAGSLILISLAFLYWMWRIANRQAWPFRLVWEAVAGFHLCHLIDDFQSLDQSKLETEVLLMRRASKPERVDLCEELRYKRTRNEGGMTNY